MTSSPRAPARVLQILELLSRDGNGRSLASLSEEMNTPKSSVLSLLRALLKTGHVSQAGGDYRLGLESYRLASAIIATRHFPEVARPIIQALADAAGETAIVAVLSNDRMSVLYVDMVESRNSIRFAARVGDRRPLYCSAGGRLLLAFLPLDEIEAYLSREKLVPLTTETVTSRKALRAILDEIRRTGLSCTVSQSAPDVSGFAAPIHEASGAVVASLLLAAPWSRAEARADAYGEMTRGAAREISRLLGYDEAASADPEAQPVPVAAPRAAPAAAASTISAARGRARRRSTG